MVLVALVNKDHINHGAAQDLFTAIYSKKIRVYISSQNILEYSTVLTKGYKLAASEVTKSISSLVGDPNFLIIYPNSESVNEYLNSFSKSPLHPTDLFLFATMKSNGINSIITDDRDFGKVKGIKAYNPFV